MHFNTNRDVHFRSREMLEIASHPNLVNCLTQLLGPDVILWRTTAFHKPPINSEVQDRFMFGDVDWHHGTDFIKPALDFAGIYPSIGVSREENLKNGFPLNITAWIAIDDATPLSGTLMFAPGSHRLGVVPYKEVESGTGFHSIGLKFAYEGLFHQRCRYVLEPCWSLPSV